MFTWLTANIPNILAGSAVLGLTALSLHNILPRKTSKGSPCAGCTGCAGCSGCCRH